MFTLPCASSFCHWSPSSSYHRQSLSNHYWFDSVRTIARCSAILGTLAPIFSRPIRLYRTFDASKFSALRLALLRSLCIDLTVCATFSAQSVLCVPFCQSLPQIHCLLCALLPFAFATTSFTCVDDDYWIASVTYAGRSVCTDFCS